MTPPAVLTQEEIAEGERLYARMLTFPDTEDDWVRRANAEIDLGRWLSDNAPRIFATIRTLQARVRELEISGYVASMALLQSGATMDDKECNAARQFVSDPRIVRLVMES